MPAIGNWAQYLVPAAAGNWMESDTLLSQHENGLPVCHQPTLVYALSAATPLFNCRFDELLLLKRGGRTIFHGPLGADSTLLIDYFMQTPGARLAVLWGAADTSSAWTAYVQQMLPGRVRAAADGTLHSCCLLSVQGMPATPSEQLLFKHIVRQTRITQRLKVCICCCCCCCPVLLPASPLRLSGVEAPGDGFNPSTWMLDISAVGSEARLGVDFAAVYQDSSLRT
jgi:hypothetical protein